MMGQDLAKLFAKVVAFDEYRIRRGAQAFVARDHDAIFGARLFEHRGAVEVRIENRVGAEYPKPSRETREHAIGSEFLHCLQRQLS